MFRFLRMVAGMIMVMAAVVIVGMVMGMAIIVAMTGLAIMVMVVILRMSPTTGKQVGT